MPRGLAVAVRENVSSLVRDHRSVLKMIEWRWGLAPLSVRDATANNLAEVLRFPTPDLSAKQLDVPQGPFGGVCTSGLAVSEDEWGPMRQLALDWGWKI